MVKIQEAEQQIVTHYEVYDQRPATPTWWSRRSNCTSSSSDDAPELVTADAGFFSPPTRLPRANSASSASRCPTSAARARSAEPLERKRWFRDAQRWRTGCEGRISLLKRRHGLNRCRYKGEDGMKRWVGLGVIADNLINIASAMDSPAVRVTCNDCSSRDSRAESLPPLLTAGCGLVLLRAGRPPWRDARNHPAPACVWR